MNWQSIFDHLKGHGFDVYALGAHQGFCKSPYLVLRNNGSTLNGSLTAQEYEILLYCPLKHYRSFEGYIANVKTAMNELFPALRLIDDQQPHYLDDDVQGYMTSLIYRLYTPHMINRITRKD